MTDDRRVGRDERTVHRADRCPDDDFRADLGLEQGADHADLDGAEHTAAAEHECDRTVRHRIILASVRSEIMSKPGATLAVGSADRQRKLLRRAQPYHARVFVGEQAQRCEQGLAQDGAEHDEFEHAHRLAARDHVVDLHFGQGQRARGVGVQIVQDLGSVDRAQRGNHVGQLIAGRRLRLDEPTALGHELVGGRAGIPPRVGVAIGVPGRRDGVVGDTEQIMGL